MSIVDPWQGMREGSQAINNTLDSLERNKMARTLGRAQLQQLQQGLMEKQAADQALVDTYGTGDRPNPQTQLAAALAFRAQEQRNTEEARAKEEKLNKFFVAVDNFKKAGATPEFLTELTKLEMSKDPGMAKIAPFVRYMDGEKITLEKDFKDNELKDPITNQPLPAGRYVIEGKRTGDPKNPFSFSSVRPSGKETWSEPYAMNAGGKKAMVQKSSSGQIRPVIQESANININAPGENQVTTLAKQVAEGRLDPNSISKRGGLQQAVYAEVEKIAPGFNFTGATANAKFATNAGNLQSRALIQGVEPLYDKLLQTGKSLGNSSIPGANKVMNWAKEQSGKPEIVAFNNLRDDVIAESERILLGSGVLSDNKYLRAVKNVNSAQSYPQLQAAVDQLRVTVKARLESLDKKPYQLNSPANQPQAAASMTATNPKTGQKIMSRDGGKTWEPMR